MKEKNSRENLTDTAKDFFHMIFQFAKLKVKKKPKNCYSRRSTSRTYNRHMWNISTLLL